MKRLLVTDTHLGLYSDSDAWLDIVLDFFKHIVKYCYKNEINEIIHLGDFFNNRKSLNTKTQHIAHRIAGVLGKVEGLHTHIIVGNHDCYYKNKIHPNTLELFKEYDHITIVDRIMLLDNIVLAPWGAWDTWDIDALFHMDAYPDKPTEYLMGHFPIKGFHMNDSYKCKDGLEKDKLRDFKRVYSGHFHTPSSNANVTYLGAPYGQTFHDAGGIRGFHVFDEGKLEFVEYKDAPKFVKIHTNPEPLDENEVKGNIVRIIFDKDYGTTINQTIIDNILNCNPFLYSVNYANIESEGETDDEIGIMDTKDQIVNQYIDNNAFPTNIKIPTLKAMFLKLLKEAGDGSIKGRAAAGTIIECESVGFQNFLSFGSKWQDVNLYKGINFVTGIDKDKGKSNGAGKSSFLETIPFALFGKTARNIRQDQIVNWKNKKNCVVVHRFRINDALYEIKRGLKPNTLDIFKDGDPIDKDAHKSDYQEMFEEIFGMDANMFMSLIHSNLNNSANIMNMKKADKRKFLERMFGLEIFSKMNQLCNDKLRVLENKKYKIKTDVDSANERIEASTRMKIKFELEIRSKQQALERVKEVKEELDRLKEDNPTLEDDFIFLDKEIKDKREAFHKITLKFETWKTKLDAEVTQLKKEIGEIEDQEEQRKTNTETQERIDKITEKAGSIDEITEKVDETNSNESGLSEKHDRKFVEVSDVEKEIVEIKTNLKNAEKNLDQLKEGICPLCGQDVKDPQTHYKKEQISFKKKLANREKKLGGVKKEKSIFLDELIEVRKKKETLSKTKETLYKLQSQIKEIGSEEKKDELIVDKSSKINKIDDATTKYDNKETKHSNEMTAMKNKLRDILLEQSVIKVKQRDYELAQSEAKIEQNHIKSLEEMIKEQDVGIEKLREGIKTLESNGVKLNDIFDYLNVIKTILKDENIKQFTIKQIMPFLNKQVNYYLSEVNYSFYVKIDKWLDVDIKGPGIRNASYDNLSGGERRGIDIALQLSMIDVARTQAGIFPDLLVFDELLDSSIDATGINELMKIVKVKQKEFDGKVFVITHRNEVDAELIDYEYKVVKENGFSKIIN